MAVGYGKVVLVDAGWHERYVDLLESPWRHLDPRAHESTRARLCGVDVHVLQRRGQAPPRVRVARRARREARVTLRALRSAISR